MIADLKNYLVGLLGGTVALLIAFLLAFSYMSIFVWHMAGQQNSGYDLVSLFVHYSSMPRIWIAVLLTFGVGFYLPLRRKLVKISNASSK
jgi:TRAP-type C4-dicarboxylate transport system permease small subunit